MNLEDLKERLPTVHWRAQTVTRDGSKALALAYMDARDVMDRLDNVCGAQNWQDTYCETVKGRVICTLSIFIDGQWVSKSDGAGDTAVEGEKGGISDAFKRSAVKWGIGRYLYDIKAPFVECESYEKNGKKYFKKWKPSALQQFEKLHPPPTLTDSQRDIIAGMAEPAGMTLQEICEAFKVKALTEIPASKFAAIEKRLGDKIKQRKDNDNGISE